MGSALQLTVLLVAATAFAAGGLFMKLSVGLTRPAATLAFLGLFCGGALLQALAMRTAELGVAYIVVLGIEAVITLLLSVLVLGESCSPSRVAAVLVVIIGIAWLRAT